VQMSIFACRLLELPRLFGKDVMVNLASRSAIVAGAPPYHPVAYRRGPVYLTFWGYSSRLTVVDVIVIKRSSSDMFSGVFFELQLFVWLSIATMISQTMRDELSA